MTEQTKQDLLNAQVAVIGCLLIDPERTAGHIMAEISESDFRDPTYRAIFSAMRSLFSTGKPIDPITVADAVGQGHVDLIAQIIDCTPTAVHYAEYCELLKKRALLSRLQSCGVSLMDAATPEECEPLLQQAMEALAMRPGVRIATMSEALAGFYDRHGATVQPVYLNWCIDELTQSIYAEAGDMIVIGGYPSDGKTSLALFFAYHMAGKGRRVGFFSYETGRDKLTDRLVAMEAQVAMPRLKKNTMSEQDWENVAAISGRMTEAHLEIIEASGMSVQQIRALALARRYEVVFIDSCRKSRARSTRATPRASRRSARSPARCSRWAVRPASPSWPSHSCPDRRRPRRAPSRRRRFPACGSPARSSRTRTSSCCSTVRNPTRRTAAASSTWRRTRRAKPTSASTSCSTERPRPSENRRHSSRARSRPRRTG